MSVGEAVDELFNAYVLRTLLVKDTSPLPGFVEDLFRDLPPCSSSVRYQVWDEFNTSVIGYESEQGEKRDYLHCEPPSWNKGLTRLRRG
jgi:hypothetical protein